MARYGVVLINPIQSIEADLAEETLNEYIRWILDAQQEQLAEHREYGLPDFAGTVAPSRQAAGKRCTFPTANIHNWLFMMVAKHYLISMRDEKASAFERTLDRYYNLAFSGERPGTARLQGRPRCGPPGLKARSQTSRRYYPPVEQEPGDNTERMQSPRSSWACST